MIDCRSAAPWLLLLALSPLSAGEARIRVDADRPGARIPSSLYGIFFEEINHAGDGGLYAELIQNRGFEDANLPPACTLDGKKIVPPRTPHFWNGRISDWTMPWTVSGDWPGWTVKGAARLTDSAPLHAATPHSLEIQSGATIWNEGHWGIGLKAGETYRLSLWTRGGPGRIRAALEGREGKALALAELRLRGGSDWTRHEVTMKAAAPEAKARLSLTYDGAGPANLDFVSLFPTRTFRNRPNGMRADLAEMIAAMKPAFVRWPGGCFVEGITVETRAQWKRTLGPLHERPGTYSPWGYWSTDGFGYHEFLQFSEDLGADALYVVNAGVSCAFRSGTYLDDGHLPELIEDTLAAIEYAIGPVTSKWGALRARNGHPRPFPLKYLEVGNEQSGPRYGERVKKFYAAIKSKYPQIQVALSSWIAGIDQRAIDAAGKIDIVDEHAYKAVHWPVENFDSFASYERGKWDLYIGEFATNAGVGRGNLLAALNDAAYMMSMEKNSDLVKMGSYAPLLENVNKRDWPVNLIHFDSSRAYGRASYHACRLFGENRPDVNLAAVVEWKPAAGAPIRGKIGLGTFGTSAEFKDVRVEAGGRALYESAFASKGAEGWAAEQRGRRASSAWTVVDGAYRQTERDTSWTYFGEDTWSALTLQAKARKISGAEGFALSVGFADGRRAQCNIGGWGNRQHALQAGDGIIGKQIPGSVEAGRWYDVKLEANGRNVRCYLDGALLLERDYPRVDRVLAIAGREDRSGDIVVKAVNTSVEEAITELEVSGAMVTRGTVTTLTSGSPGDENSFDVPGKVAPATRALTDTRRLRLPAYSLSVIRLRTKR
ncbi:MAG TPA: alpha-L-arabinofuranosidase [Solibacterales bacterium]|nr:alpha-L-arabinofuranosidase [Bryobacterales bacterium]